MFHHRPLVFAFVVGAVLVLPAAAQPVGIHWQNDVESAKKQARESGRLVLVHFWTESCGPCKMLEQNVFNQAGVGTAIESQFVPVKLNADQNSATASGFGIVRVPTDVIITPDGEVVARLISPPTPSSYIAELSQVAYKYSTRSGQAFAQAAAGAPTPNGQVNSAYAGLAINNGTPPAIAAAAAPVTNAGPTNRFAVAAPSAAVPGQVAAAAALSQPAAGAPASYAALQQPQASRYAASAPPASAPPADAQALAPPQLAGQPLAPPQITPPMTMGNRYAATPAVEPAAAPAVVAPTPDRVANPYIPALPQQQAPFASAPPALPIAPFPATATSPAAAQPPAAPPANDAAAQESRRLPPGAPPLGFDGYCPVSMRTQWKWVTGNPQYGIIHRGRTYWFAGADEQKQFWENPDHFSPALSGFDPVIALDHKQQVPGKREHSLDYDNLFYLFSSEATLQQFAANPERYAAGIRQAMNIQRGRFVR